MAKALARTEGAPGDLHVVKPASWTFEQGGFAGFRAIGPNERVSFTLEDAALVFTWLQDEAPADLHFGNDALLDFLGRFGAITRADPVHSSGIADMTGTLVKLVTQRIKGTAPGDVSDENEPAASGIFVSWIGLLTQLILLKQAFDVVWAYRSDGAEAAAERLRANFSQWIESAQEVADEFGVTPDSAWLVRTWIALQVDLEGMRGELVLPPDDGPWRVALSPASASEFLWVVLAVTVDALEPPYPMPGVHSCDYCRRLFVGNRSGVKGTNVFCSARHGKNFWARETMRKKRAAIKAASAKGRG